MKLTGITRIIGASKLVLKAHGPTIMVAGGIVTAGVGTILACRQTLKIEEVLAERADALETIKTGEELNLKSYSKEDAFQDRVRVYTGISIDLARIYVVPAALWIGGAGLILKGHHVSLKRNAALALAFTGLKKTFDLYRDRVVNEFGPTVDQAMLSGHKIREIYDEKSKKSAVIRERDWEEAERDPYNRVFNQYTSASWQPDLGVNKMFLDHQRQYAQQILDRRGYLYLSEVYEALGFPETDISRVVGWKAKRNPDGSRDFPTVDFGLDTPIDDGWKYDRDKAVYLDFNCHGLIIGGKVQKILEAS